ncbi:MAG TPA: Ig-like domain-containing protein [Corynebacterium xerosis]|uniref:L,D-transpeptidase n=1 Tax=Corynebacterium xerosis TaxID=1725 RepID=UPI001D44FD71|nr:Ig-like domain-containing protein [Corynebacterium xerosis]HJG56087.1 Ig-like domain-containing protein [Corynebacterium xerosis]
MGVELKRRRGAFRGGRLRAAVAAVGVAALGLTGCTVGEGNGAEEAAQVEEANPKPVANVEDGAEDWSVLDPVTVEIDGAKLDSVEMTNDEGKEVAGELSEDGTSWTTTENLGYGRTYTLEAKAGEEELSSSFQTVVPTTMTYGYLSPQEGSTVGVGQPIAIRFDEPIADRHAAQEAIKVTTEPAVEGAFYWLNNSEVRWRPAEYWPSGTTVNVEVDIYGKDLGNGYYGQENNSTNFTIGDRVVAIADDATKTMTIERNGVVENSMPISMGSGTWPTPNGTYMIGDQHQNMVMDSTTYGLALEDGGYKTPVKYATQMSYSGIYVHGAPWSVWAQGSQNVSHGCINVTDANAAWFQQNTKRGDIVIVKNTIGGTLPGTDGLGDWNIPWETWKKGNADETSSW